MVTEDQIASLCDDIVGDVYLDREESIKRVKALLSDSWMEGHEAGITGTPSFDDPYD